MRGAVICPHCKSDLQPASMPSQTYRQKSYFLPRSENVRTRPVWPPRSKVEWASWIILAVAVIGGAAMIWLAMASGN